MSDSEAEQKTKRCPYCDTVKGVDEFYVSNSGTRPKISNYCKPCCSRRMTKYNRENHERVKQRKRESYHKHKHKRVVDKERSKQDRQRARGRIRGRMYDLFASARDRAKKKGVPFELTRDYLLDLWCEQQGDCALTGITMRFDVGNGDSRFMPFNISLDRIVPSRGYVVGNVRLVCVAANLALNEFGEDVFRQVCEGYMRTHPL